MGLEIPKLAFNVANVVIFAAILYGIAVHARRTLHVRVMTACFVADLLVVLLIELQRKAIEQAMGPASPLLRFHIAVSVALLVLWILQIVAGRQILQGKPRLRRHRAQAWAFVACRVTNVVTAFMVSD